jgi:hypothetical protein
MYYIYGIKDYLIMKKIFIFLTFLLINIGLFSYEYKVDSFVFDFSEGWNVIKGDDPQSVLKIEKDGSTVEFIKLEDELSDFYLNSRLTEQREALINKGLKPEDIKSTTIHYAAKFYYFVYHDKKLNTVGLFTYQGVTYNFLSSGLDEGNVKKLIFNFKKPGEKIELPPPPKPKPIAKKVKKPEPKVQYISITESTQPLSLETSTKPEVSVSSTSISTVTEADVSISTITSTEAVTEALKEQPKESVQSLILSRINSSIENAINQSTDKQIIKRTPINKYFMLVLLILYIIITIYFKSRFSKYSNPRIKPYPKEMPPDFLFPFIITRVVTPAETMSQIITRNNQFLSSHFNHEYKKYYKWGVIGIVVVHILWSLGEFVKEGFFAAAVSSLPLGNYIISFIELPFIAIIIYSVVLKKREKQKLVISDSQTNTICEVAGERNIFVTKDNKGRDVLKVRKIGSYFKRQWECLNEDDNVIFTIKDDHPDIWLAVKLLGNKLLRSRSYYSIYVDNDKRIGFLFLDQNSINGYQVHFDYDYFRLANPVHVVAIFLYIISNEREENILFI